VAQCVNGSPQCVNGSPSSVVHASLRGGGKSFECIGPCCSWALLFMGVRVAMAESSSPAGYQTTTARRLIDIATRNFGAVALYFEPFYVLGIGACKISQ
jgi:hypothetical protein